MWMHEQDIRRAVGRPGGLDGPAARAVVRVFARSLGFVVGKRVAPPAGTSVLLEVTGAVPLRTAVVVGEDGRAGTPAEEPADPTVTLRMGVEALTVLSGGGPRPRRRRRGRRGRPAARRPGPGRARRHPVTWAQ